MPPAPRTAPPRIMAIANQKGGVGKTTTAINLGTALAAMGAPVLLLDLDPQGNASTGLGLQPEERRVSSYEILMGAAPLAQAAVPSCVPGLDLAPATMDLLAAETQLAQAPDRALRLRGAMRKKHDKPYAYIIIDCPPSLNLLTLNALAAATSLLVPLQCEFLALEGLSQLLRTVDHVRDTLNPELLLQGVVLTMADRRNRLSEQVAADVRRFLGNQVYKTVIPRNVRISEAPSHGKPVLVYDHRCAGSRAYMSLASEVIRQDQAPGQVPDQTAPGAAVAAV